MNKFEYISALSGSCILLLFLAGCTSSGSPTPASATMSTPGPSNTPTGDVSSTESSDNEGQVEVSNPVDAKPYIMRACSTLSSDQVAKLGGDPGSADKKKSGDTSSCSWEAQKGIGVFSISFTTKYKNGLAHVKAEEAKMHLFDISIDTTVGEYPALILNQSGDQKSGRCNLEVGVNRSVILKSQVNGSNVTNPCDGAKNLAAAAIDTMRKGS